MEYDRESGQTLADLFQNVETQRRRNEHTVGIARALLRLELVRAVAGADGDGEGIHAGLCHKFFHFFRTRVGGILRRYLYVVLYARQSAQLTLDDDTSFVRIFHDLAGQGDVVLECVVGAVDHNGGKAAVDARLADLKIRAVVEVEGEVDVRVTDRGLCQRHQIFLLRVLARACGYLQHNGRTKLACRFRDCLDDLQVVDVERTDGVAAFVCLAEHFLCGNECHTKISFFAYIPRDCTVYLLTV